MIGVQFICAFAWVSLVSFTLYATNSIIAAIFTYFVGVSLLSLPTIFYPDVDWLKYLDMQFYFDISSHFSLHLVVYKYLKEKIYSIQRGWEKDPSLVLL